MGIKRPGRKVVATPNKDTFQNFIPHEGKLRFRINHVVETIHAQ